MILKGYETQCSPRTTYREAVLKKVMQWSIPFIVLNMMIVFVHNLETSLKNI